MQKLRVPKPNVIRARGARSRTRWKLQGRECDLFKGFKVSDTIDGARGRRGGKEAGRDSRRADKRGRAGGEVTSSLHNCVTLSGESRWPGRASTLARVFCKNSRANWIPLARPSRDARLCVIRARVSYLYIYICTHSDGKRANVEERGL